MNNSHYIEIHVNEHNITAHIYLSEILTTTDLEVFKLLINGYAIKQIAKRRTRSNKTISLQKNNIYKKLNIRNDITFG